MKTTIIIILMAALFVVHNKINIPNLAKKHVILLENDSGSGTGFYVMYKGKSHLITNKHVCGSAEGLDTTDGYSRVISVYSEHDLCLLESHRIGGLRISKTKLKKLDKVHTIGHPLKFSLTYFSGHHIGRPEPRDSLILALPVFPGASGSPVMNDLGYVVGVVFAGSKATYHHALAVPRDILLDFLHETSKY